MIIGLFLIAFDYVISPDGLIRLDLLPDFIGYGIFAYGFFKLIRQEKCHEADSGSKTVLAQNKKNQSGKKGNSQGKTKKVVVSKSYQRKDGGATGKREQNRNERSVRGQTLINTLRYGMVTACVLLLIFYVVYLMDMYGRLQQLPQGVSFGISIFKDMGLLLMMYWYISALTVLQGKHIFFRIKRLSLLWKITALCMLCECISLSEEIVMLTFIIFERVVEMIFMVYMWEANRNYKKHFLKTK